MRKLIICNDGTWNSPDDKDRGKVKPTNITKISRALLPVDSNGHSQVVFYNEGVGTSFGEKILGGVTGFGISKNILDAYRFLSHNYSSGDEIYVFGFSRGAYTSMSLVGFMDKVGLVAKDDVFYLPHLFDFYRTQSSANEVDAFCNEKSLKRHHPRIKLLGLFDAVGALGLPIPGANNLFAKTGVLESTFHDVQLKATVDYAYHALAIDEHRKPFAPTLWSKSLNETIDMEQRWFAGVHSNIGGGYNPDDLANFALKYMTGQASKCGLEFDAHYLSFYGGNIKTPIRDSMSFKYRVLGKNLRKITLDDTSGQVIDESVFTKQAEDNGYQPANVAV